MMIVMGGMDDDDHGLSTTELLGSTTGQWFKCNDLPQPLTCLPSVIVGGLLYTLGGLNTNGNSKAVYAAPLHALSNHQLQWQQLADTPWEGSTAVSVNNKYLLAVGGDAEHDTLCVLKIDKAGSMITSTSWESIVNKSAVLLLYSHLYTQTHVIYTHARAHAYTQTQHSIPCHVVKPEKMLQYLHPSNII